MVFEEDLRTVFAGGEYDTPYIIFRIVGLLEDELGVSVSRTLERQVVRSMERKSTVLEKHMEAFKGALLNEVEKDLLTPLVALLEAKKSNDDATFEEKLSYFENLLQERLTKKESVCTVNSELQVTK